MCVTSYREAITASSTRAALLASTSASASALLRKGRSKKQGRPIRDGLGRVLGRLRASSSGLRKRSGVRARGEEGKETVWRLSKCP